MECSERQDIHNGVSFNITTYVCYNKNGEQLSSRDQDSKYERDADYYLRWANWRCNESEVTTTTTTVKPSTTKTPMIIQISAQGESFCSLRIS